MIFRRNQGDTIVEVLLATVVLSIVLAAAYNLTNRATKINQLAHERAQVTGYMQRQAEYLKALKTNDTSSPGEPWDDVVAKSSGTPSYFDCSSQDLSNLSSIIPSEAFYVAYDSGSDSFVVTDGFENIPPFYNVWVTGERKDSGNHEYIDFYVYGCWEGADRGINQEAGFVSRINL